jgi:hypothetical protein
MPRAMGWFRLNSGKFAWVAFFALACDFALTFGHLHLRNDSVVFVARMAPADSINASTGAQSSPAKQAPTGLAQDFCAICNNINLANTLILSVSLAPVPPTSIFRDLRWQLVSVSRAARHLLFNARGPPYASPAAT